MPEMVGTRERRTDVKLRHLPGERPEGLDRGDKDVSVLPHTLVATVREEQGLRPGGLGLVMTRALVDELIYNEARNEVVFIKYLD